MLSHASVLRRSTRPTTAPADDELVMLDSSQGFYYGLNAVGRRVWELLEEPQDVLTLCGRLQEEFDVPAQTCQDEVVAFLERLQAEDLVSVEERR